MMVSVRRWGLFVVRHRTLNPARMAIVQGTMSTCGWTRTFVLPSSNTELHCCRIWFTALRETIKLFKCSLIRKCIVKASSEIRRSYGSSMMLKIIPMVWDVVRTYLLQYCKSSFLKHIFIGYQFRFVLLN